jgi:hypothetical protein
MSNIYNIYCDEACHLEHDHQKVMVLGAIWCPLEAVKKISSDVRDIKSRHGLARDFEIKWVKISPSKIDFYLEIADFFFDTEKLHFRTVVIPDKEKLNHVAFSQDHDQWYYKMFFVLLKQIFDPHARYRIYLDIKDTRSQQKVKKLHEVLCNNFYDFDKTIIERVQQVRSHEVEIMQITDLLIGALAYAHRGLTTSQAKMAFIQRLRKKSGHTLLRTTLPREEKMNILVWSPQEW